MKVLFVCLGNICRSPTAEGVLRALVQRAGLQRRITVDSAGTHGFHVGVAPDKRSQQHAARRGYDLSRLRARQLTARDFERFDLVLVMDEANEQAALALCPPAHAGRSFAAYGGVYIAVALAWLWTVDGIRPTAWDVAGVLAALAGMAIIMFQPAR